MKLWWYIILDMYLEVKTCVIGHIGRHCGYEYKIGFIGILHIYNRVVTIMTKTNKNNNKQQQITTTTTTKLVISKYLDVFSSKDFSIVASIG